jgi:hypothetical protein
MMTVFTLAGKYLIHALVVCAWMALSSAEITECLTLTYTPSSCSGVIQATGCTASVEVVSNVSMTTFITRNDLSHTTRYLFFSKCNSTMDVHLLNSNVSFNLNNNTFRIQAMNLSVSWVKFQNGSLVAGGAVLVPELSVFELDHAILESETGYEQASLTIIGTFIVCLYYCVVLDNTCHSGTINLYHSKVDIDTFIRTISDVKMAGTIVVPLPRRLTFDSRVSILRPTRDTSVQWVLVILGELTVSTRAEVHFAQGKVFVASNATLVLNGTASFEALSLGTDYFMNGGIKQPSTRTCVTGSGAFSTLLRSKAGYELAIYEIFCEISASVSFVFNQITKRPRSRFEADDEITDFLSTELTLLIGLNSFTANFDSAQQGNKLGFKVKIENINNGTFLDLRINNIYATYLSLVGSIKISETILFYVHRLDVLGSGTGALVTKGEVPTYCSRHLNRLFVTCFRND